MASELMHSAEEEEEEEDSFFLSESDEDNEDEEEAGVGEEGKQKEGGAQVRLSASGSVERAGADEDPDYTEELVLLSVPGCHAAFVNNAESISLSGLDTDAPVIHLGANGYFVGRWQETNGTRLLFSPPASAGQPPILAASLNTVVAFETAIQEHGHMVPLSKKRSSQHVPKKPRLNR